MVIREAGQMTADLARQRVQWESENRISKALATTYKVQGWRQSNGQIWRHNQIVRVVDSIIGFDRDMLVVEIEYSQSNAEGMLTKLTVAPPDGFAAEPLTKRKKVKGKKKGKDNFEFCCRQIGRSNEQVGCVAGSRGRVAREFGLEDADVADAVDGGRGEGWGRAFRTVRVHVASDGRRRGDCWFSRRRPSHGVALVVADRRFRPLNLKPGEVAIFTSEGDSLIFRNGRIAELTTGTFRVNARKNRTQFADGGGVRAGCRKGTSDRAIWHGRARGRGRWRCGDVRCTHSHAGRHRRRQEHGAAPSRGDRRHYGRNAMSDAREAMLRRAVEISLFTWRRAELAMRSTTTNEWDGGATVSRTLPAIESALGCGCCAGRC
jgi:hypothetical protein